MRPSIPPTAAAAFLSGVHQIDDEYRMALYEPGAALGDATSVYSPAGEVVGPGYEAGGLKLDGWSVTMTKSGAYIGFRDVTWPRATVTARAALVYNASRADAAVLVLDFGEDVSSTDGRFLVKSPEGGALIWRSVN